MAEQPSPLVLASGSPRRRALLAQVGIEVVVRPTDVRGPRGELVRVIG